MIVTCTKVGGEIRTKGEACTRDAPELLCTAIYYRVFCLMKIINISGIADDKRRHHLVSHHQQAGCCTIFGEIERGVARRGDYSRISRNGRTYIGADLRV